MPTGKGGNTGGFLALHGTRRLTHLAHSYVKEGNGWMALGVQQGTTLFVIQLYVRTGEHRPSEAMEVLTGPRHQEVPALRLGVLVHGDEERVVH